MAAPVETSSRPETPRIPSYQPQSYLLVALGIITLIGSLVAVGALHGQIGSAAFLVGGVGILTTTLPLLVGGFYCIQPPEHSQPISPKQPQPRDVYAYRAQIFQETMQLHREGDLSTRNQPMIDGTCTYTIVDPIPPTHKTYQTRFSVIEDDTLNVLLRLAEQGKNPVGINMANRYTPGGGVTRGCPAQEEAVCRRSNHYLGLTTQHYPLPEFGGIYCPHVVVSRADEAHHYALLENPTEVALVAVAAYDLRKKSREHETTNNIPAYAAGMKSKIRNMLRIMHTKGHHHLVLGALGCGAFQNDPRTVAGFFQEIFLGEEFKGRFEVVQFAILNLFPNDQNNIDAFSTLCASLNPHSETQANSALT